MLSTQVASLSGRTLNNKNNKEDTLHETTKGQKRSQCSSTPYECKRSLLLNTNNNKESRHTTRNTLRHPRAWFFSSSTAVATYAHTTTRVATADASEKPYTQRSATTQAHSGRQALMKWDVALAVVVVVHSSGNSSSSITWHTISNRPWYVLVASTTMQPFTHL